MINEENLDFILSIAKEYNHKSKYDLEEWQKKKTLIHKKIGDHTPHWPLTGLYYSKLLKEDMIVPFSFPTENGVTECYKATYKGYFFEGYAKEYKRKKIIYRRDRLTIRILNSGAIGGAIAGGYAVYLIVKDLLHPIQTGGETVIKQIGLFF